MAIVVPVLGIGGASPFIGLQVGYNISDLTAKALSGGVICERADAEGHRVFTTELRAA